MPRSGIAAACAACPRYTTSTSAMHTHGMFTRLTLEGCIIIAASTPVERALARHQLLAAAALLGGRAEHAHAPGQPRAERREREPRADARGRDQVVAAGVADLGQRVVLGEHARRRARSRAELGRERGRSP